MATKKRLTYTHDEVQALLDRIIEVIKVNGIALPISEREVDITVPTKLSDLGEFTLSSDNSVMSLFPEGIDIDGDMGTTAIRENRISVDSGGPHQTDRTEIRIGGKLKYHNATYQLPGNTAADSGTLATMEKLDADNIAYIGPEDGQGSLPADFDPYTDTVWNKAQVLSPAQQEQVRQNIGIGIDMTKVITTDDEVIIDCGTSTT